MPANPIVLSEREEIRAGIERGDTVTQIAEDLDRSRSAVSEEINRNGGRDAYRAVAAQHRADQQRKRPKQCRLHQNPQLAGHVETRLRAKDSPATIAAELANGTYPLIAGRVSHETIYQAVQARGCRGLPTGLAKCLHRGRARRKPNRRTAEPEAKTSPLGLFTPLSARPAEADNRDLCDGGVIGHFEGDLILGAFNRSAIVTVFERVTNLCLLADLPEGHGSGAVLAALVELIDRIPEHLRRSLAWDQGREIACWPQVQDLTGMAVYIANPHAPWERPVNENGNGLLRRWLPKGTDLGIYTPADLRAIEHRVNTMPRRRHNGQSATDLYYTAL